MQLPRADYLAPIAPQQWHFRQSVDYSVTANRAVLDYAARHREQLLSNIWLMGHNAIERGGRDSWTVTPKVVAAARHRDLARRRPPALTVQRYAASACVGTVCGNSFVNIWAWFKMAWFRVTVRTVSAPVCSTG